MYIVYIQHFLLTINYLPLILRKLFGVEDHLSLPNWKTMRGNPRIFKKITWSLKVHP